MIEIKECSLDHDTHMKGYMYDSLMYRYMMARERMAFYEWENRCKYDHKASDKHIYEERAKRDILRFAQILDEAIGDHD